MLKSGFVFCRLATAVQAKRDQENGYAKLPSSTCVGNLWCLKQRNIGPTSGYLEATVGPSIVVVQ